MVPSGYLSFVANNRVFHLYSGNSFLILKISLLLNVNASHVTLESVSMTDKLKKTHYC